MTAEGGGTRILGESMLVRGFARGQTFGLVSVKIGAWMYRRKK